MFNDAQARLESVDVNHSIILQAPAGSGKTSLLVDRFINLLKICQDPCECLAITFSKKAAFEMRYRVLQKLEQLTYRDNTSIYRQVLDNPNKLKILTIDALCASLANQAPILSRCGLNLKINASPEKLYQEAVEQLLTSFDNPDLIIKIFEYFSNDYELIKNLFVDLLYKREQWLPLIMPIKLAHTSNDLEAFDIKKFLEQNLQQAINDILEDLLKHIPNKEKQKKILDLAKYAASNINDHKNNMIFCKDLQDCWPDANYSSLPVWQGLTELLLTKDSNPRIKVTATQGFLPANAFKDLAQKRIAQQLKNEMQNLLIRLREDDTVFLSKLKQIMILPKANDNGESWDLLQSLFFLLPELVAHLMLVFKEKQEVDFTQVAIAALEAIGTENHATDLSLFLDYKINHILVDEFQDTSLLQFNLIEKLISGWSEGDHRTIFLVGDPMQSIYRFRQANVNLFIKAQRFGIGNVKLKNLYLNTNFRSTESIVNNLNELFINIFPANNDIIYSGVAYSPSIAYKPTIEIDLQNNSKQANSSLQFLFAEDAVQEARIISDLTQKIKQQNPKYSIAILIRTRSHAIEIIKCLRKDNVPYQANDIEPIDHHAIVNDLSSLTKVILYPQDVIAWLALLRSPLVGLQLSDLHAFYLNTEINSFRGCLLNQLYHYKDNSNLSDEARCRLDFVLPIIFGAIRQKEAVHLSQLVKKTWKLLGGDLFSTSFDLQVAEDYFHRLLKIPDIFVINSIDDLISQSFVQASKSQINPQDLQIMTIHKSKGLEFDVVILPSMNKSPKSHKQSLFLWEERTNFKGNYLLFAPTRSAMQSKNSIYNFLKHSEHEKDSHEAKRLLYVAMTRARKNFYGFGSSLDCISSNSFLKYLQPYINVNTNQVAVQKQYDNINIEKGCSQLTLKLKRIPISWYEK
jgi:ATP-dependent helicase/nuclease subunit A